MNQDVGGNRKLFWKGMSKVNGGQLKICSIIRYLIGKLSVGEDDVRKIWKEHF